MIRQLQPDDPSSTSTVPADADDDRITDEEQRVVETTRADLRAFVRAIWAIIEPRFPLIGGFYFDALCDHAQAFALRQIQNIVVTIPPRFTKSTVWSIALVPWIWTRDPRRRVLTASFGGGPQLEHAVRARTVIDSIWYQRHFGETVRFREDQNEKDYYENTAGGYRITTHVGGATGKGGDLTILDDPHNIEERNSRRKRDAAIGWHDTVWYGRLDDLVNGGRAVIQQRIGTNDLAGHLLATGEYEHLNLPQEFSRKRQVTIEAGVRRTVGPTSIGWIDPRQNDGELLCPSRMGPKQIAASRKLLKGDYQAIQNQDPLPETGNLFKREWFVGKIVKKAPPDLVRVRSWDAAATEDDGDYSAGVKIGKARDGRIFVEHVARGQWGPKDADAVLFATAEADGIAVHIFEEQEPGSAGKKICTLHQGRLRKFSYSFEVAGDDKPTKARPFRSACEHGDVYLVEGEWNAAFLDELCAFNKGDHDDQVDGAANGYNWLEANAVGLGDLVVG